MCTLYWVFWEDTHIPQIQQYQKQVLLGATLGISFFALKTDQGVWPVLTDEGDMHHPGHQPWAPALPRGCLVGLGNQVPVYFHMDSHLLSVPMGAKGGYRVLLHKPIKATNPLPRYSSMKGLRGGWDFNSSTGKCQRGRWCQQVGWGYKLGLSTHTYKWEQEGGLL